MFAKKSISLCLFMKNFQIIFSIIYTEKRTVKTSDNVFYNPNEIRLTASEIASL